MLNEIFVNFRIEIHTIYEKLKNANKKSIERVDLVKRFAMNILSLNFVLIQPRTRSKFQITWSLDNVFT